MSLKKIFTVLLAAALVPCTMTVDAAKTSKKKSSHKTTAVAKNKKKSSSSRDKSSSKKTYAYRSKAQSAQAAAATTASKMVFGTNETLETGDVSGEAIVKTAMQYIGVPYRHGTSSPKSFDCSGFTSYVYKQFDIALSRDSRSQYTQGKTIKNTAELRAGDLVFFRGRNNAPRVGHVGIVTEVNEKDKTFKFVHASVHGVRTDVNTSSYYSQRFVGAKRILSLEDVQNEAKSEQNVQ